MLNSQEIIEFILKKRNIIGKEEIDEFLSLHPQKTYDPFLLLNMKAGVDLTLSEIDKKHKICIYGDYDADGVTSICIIYTILKQLTDNIVYYIPSRIEEGYGLNKKAIKNLAEDGVNLIISVDCGSTSIDEVEYARDLGLEIIVTDHHSIGDNKPNCLIINPKQEECTYPYKYLAGCGVAFKFAQAITNKKGLSKKVLNSVLDLLAIGTIADVVPLQDENRTFVKYGLKAVNSKQRMSLLSLIENITLDTVNSSRIAFTIAPHINAPGRIGDAIDGVKLFLSEDEIEIKQQVDKLINANNKRKSMQEEGYNKAIDLCKEDEDIIILHIDDIHEGIAGIVAGKIKEDYNRTTIITTLSNDGLLKGTGRSIDNINIYDLLKENSELFNTFGGHKAACGFTIKKSNMEVLKNNLYAQMRSLKDKSPNLLDKIYKFDMELDGSCIDIELADAVKELEPFGEKNENPLFKLCGVLPEKISYMGKNRQHIKFIFKKDNKGNHDFFDCIKWNASKEHIDLINSGRKIDIIGKVDINLWNGNRKPQIIIEDIVYEK